jgi:cation diffusion facilitator family transporter
VYTDPTRFEGGILFSWHLRLPVLLSIAAALATIGLKFFAYWITGSVSLFSDAIESLVNLLASVTAFLSLWYAAQPVDAEHTYGHEKIEYFSSGMEGALILVAAGSIAWSGVERLRNPQPLEQLGIGLGVSVVAALINLTVAVMLLRVGRKYRSIVLEADGHHLMTDVWTSVGVVVALTLVQFTGWDWLDPLVAILVAINVCWTAVGLIRRSFDGLMDHALPESEQALVRTALEANMRPGMHFHALRTRQAGARRFVDYHLLVPGSWSVTQAHAISDSIEDAVRKALAAEITVHIEPIEVEASWQDSELLPLEPKRLGQ